MKTEILKISSLETDRDKIKFAASILKKGGLVAFPTETVYGLGANALDSSAVGNIFKAKSRPSDNPLIAHVSNMDMVYKLAKNVPEIAKQFMHNFWPGPLTLVMDKTEIVPQIVTAGLDTVGIRMPSHPVALALIEEAGVPVAAPSANTSGKPSPTTAEHVISDLSGKVDVIIDSGNADIGLESTVLDVTSEPPMILRPGGITFEQLSAVAGNIVIDKAVMDGQSVQKPKAPGMKYRHYAPNAKLIIIKGSLDKTVEKIRELSDSYKQKGLKVGILATKQTKDMYAGTDVFSLGDRNNPSEIAATFFYALREFDKRNVDIILAEAIERTGIGFAVMNRMMKAAGNDIIIV